MFKRKTDIEELYSAIDWGRKSKASGLIKSINDLTQQDSEYGYTPLIYALRSLSSTSYDENIFSFTKSKRAIIQNLIDQMGDFSQLTKLGNDTLMVALSCNIPNTFLEQLIELTKDLTQQNDDGHTALVAAIVNREQQLAGKILDKMDNADQVTKNNSTALTITLRKGGIKLAEKIFEKTNNVNQADNDGQTALTYALYQRDTKFALKIIEKMTDFSSKGDYGNTDLIYALNKENVEVAEALIEKMTDFSQQNNDGDNALMVAIKNGQTDLAIKIVQKMDDFNSHNRNNKTALQLAEEGLDDVVKAIKLQQGDYDTTLIHLMKHHKNDEAKKLVKERATEQGKIDFAVENNNIQQIESILMGKDSFSPLFNNISDSNAQNVADSLRMLAQSIDNKYANNNDTKIITPSLKKNN